MDVEIPAFAEDRNGRRFGFEQGADVRVLLDLVLRKACGAEGGQPRVIQFQLAGAAEEFLVARIGVRPSAFDIVDPELIEFLRDDELVIERERDSLALRAVAEGGVEGLDAHWVRFLYGVHRSVNAARTSACATLSGGSFLRDTRLLSLL